MLLYEKEGKLNLDFAKFPLTTPDVSVAKSGIAITVKLNGVDALTGSSSTITVSLESNDADHVTVSDAGAITSSVAKVSLKATTTTEGITLKYSFDGATSVNVPDGGVIEKTYEAIGDTYKLKLVGVASNSTLYSKEFPITVTALS